MAYKSFLSLCLEMILNYQISPKDHVAVFNTELKIDYPHITFNHEMVTEFIETVRKPDLYIADLEQFSLNETLADFQQRKNFNPRAKFIFLSSNVTEEEFKNLAELFISQVIFIDKSTGQISTYYPYKNNAIHNMHFEVFVKDSCLNMIRDKNISTILFDNKIPEFWNNSEITYCYLIEKPLSIGPDEKKKGINLDMFSFIASRLHLKLVWKLLKYPVDANLTTYTKESVTTFKCDINAELFPIDGVDYTHPHIFEELPFYVPAPLPIPRWQYLLRCFTIEIWLFWVVSCFILSANWVTVNIVLEKKWNRLELLEIFWLNFEHFIEQSHYVSTKYISLKVLLFLNLLQSFLLNMIFRCNFNLVLSGVIYEEPISSLRDIVDRKLTLGLFQVEEIENIRKIVGDKSGKIDFEGCDESDYCLNRTAFVRDMAVHSSLKIFSYHKQNFMDKDGSPIMVKLEPVYRKEGLCGVLPLGHPLTPFINKYLLEMYAYGFNKYILDLYDFGKEKNLVFQLQLSKLTLEHIMAPFAMLFFGYFVAFLVFIWEIMRTRMKNRPNQLTINKIQ